MPASEAAREAWELFWQIFLADKPRRLAVLQELGLSFQQGMALGVLRPGEPRTMSELAGAMQCDNSNVTGIVDRLEAAGIAERRPAAHDRRVKTVVLTGHGEELQTELHRRAGTPPPELAALAEEDATALRDILARAVEGPVAETP